MGTLTQEETDELNDLRRIEQLENAMKPSPLVDFAQQFVGRGLDAIEFIGGPSHAVEKTEDGFIPAKSGVLREQAGIPSPSDTMSGRAGEFAFDAAASTIPIGKVFQKVKAAKEGAGKFATFARNVATSIGNRFKSAPIKTTVQEAALGASSGATGYAIERDYPDTPGARVVGEILGGAGPGLAVDAAKLAGQGALKLGEMSPIAGVPIRWTANVMRTARERARTPLTTRTSRRIDRATADRPGALIAMDEDLARIDKMTPAQRTGDPGLLSLEKSVMDSSDRLRAKHDEKLSALNDALKSDFVASGSVDDTVASFEQELGYYRVLTNERLKDAALLSEERVERMIPGRPREVVNRVVRNEIDAAFSAASVHETMLFDKIDQDALVNINSSQSTVEDFVKEMGSARHGDIPRYAVKVLHPKGKGYTPITDVRELRGIQSRLRETSRTSRAAGKFNRARIADEIADSITDDISTIEEVGDNVRMAVGYSRYKNETFRQGNVGKILGYIDTGEGRIPSGLTLETTLGASGTGRGREAFDDIVKAAGISPDVRAAMDDFVRDDFITKTVRGGEFNKEAAEAYLANNKETLLRMPHLQQDIQSAIDANNAQAFTQKTMKRLNPQEGRATLFIEKSPGAAFDSALSARNPRAEMHKLINMTDRDSTGRAKQGLKTAFSQYILDGATTADGFISGQKVSEFLGDSGSRGAMEALFSKSEMLAMTRIMRSAQRLDLARNARGSVEGITGEPLDAAVGAMARFIGAAYGRTLGTGTIQVPEIFADRAEAFARARIENPSRKLLIASVQDEKLFRAMLESESSNDVIKDKALSRLNAWMAGILLQEASQEEDK